MPLQYCKYIYVCIFCVFFIHTTSQSTSLFKGPQKCAVFGLLQLNNRPISLGRVPLALAKNLPLAKKNIKLLCSIISGGQRGCFGGRLKLPGKEILQLRSNLLVSPKELQKFLQSHVRKFLAKDTRGLQKTENQAWLF